jgi:hypothetical protein
MGSLGSIPLGNCQSRAELEQAISPDLGTQQGKQLTLLLVHVMPHVLRHDSHLGVKSLVGWIEIGQLPKLPFDDVVLLEGFEYFVD